MDGQTKAPRNIEAQAAHPGPEPFCQAAGAKGDPWQDGAQ